MPFIEYGSGDKSGFWEISQWLEPEKRGRLAGDASLAQRTRCSPRWFVATVYRFLRIDTAPNFHDHSGRPIRVLNEGQPIPELLA
jgi:hypothetical protein